MQRIVSWRQENAGGGGVEFRSRDFCADDQKGIENEQEAIGGCHRPCIELSSKLHGVEIVIKGLHNKISEITTEIDEVSTKLFFHYKDGQNDE